VAFIHKPVWGGIWEEGWETVAKLWGRGRKGNGEKCKELGRG